MALAPGTRLGHYEIAAQIGAGGMGDVYKARDTRLDRIVALKISKEEFTPRFETEARATAALEHPHICRLYDVCHEGPTSFLVMEHVEGTPLAGPLPLDRVLTYAGQIASALDEAHRKHIVHRDLKPSNILITPKGGVKLLDFGLARVGSSDAPLDDAALTRGVTAAGTILGTLHYMSPEQLQGGVADARSDIFAFGLVLYEMLTGKRAFDGASAASVIAAILERSAPSVSSVAPSSLDRLLQRCLAKDPDERWQSARDVKAALELIVEPAITVPQTAVSGARRASLLWSWLVAGALATGLAGLAAIHFREESPRAGIVTFQIPAPEKTSIVSNPMLSPDGRSVAFVAAGDNGVRAIWVRSVDALEVRLLAGTEHAGENIFWSPDGRFIAFSADGKLKAIELSGGGIRTVSDVPAAGGGSWNAEGLIIFSRFRLGLFRVSASGGDPVQLTKPTEKESGHFAPVFMPDGRHFLYVAATGDRRVEARLAGLDGSELQRYQLEDGTRVGYVPPQPGTRLGHLLFVRGDALIAQPLDDSTFAPVGEQRQVADNIGNVDTQAPGAFSVSSTGALAYLAGDTWSVSQLTWFDREGKALSTVGPAGKYNDLSLSPDETRLAVTRREGDNDDIWLVDLDRDGWTRFTVDAAQDWHPVWSPDANRLVFSSTRLLGARTNSVFWKETSNIGKEEVVVRAAMNLRVNDWSPDGKYLLISRTENRGDLLVAPVDPDARGGERTLMPYLESREFSEVRGQFYPVTQEPGGRHWVAYTSSESGRLEIYVESFPRGAPKTPISSQGGMQPRWRRDGRELLYMSLDRKLMAVDVAMGPQLRFGVPKQVFQTRLSVGGTYTPPVVRYDVTRDGKRFLINSEPEGAEKTSVPITVVLNWQESLNR
jgi:Tol biopolymer transport system component/tRNA A-37 threonylcarbamoyl transferase component Bud32